MLKDVQFREFTEIEQHMVQNVKYCAPKIVSQVDDIPFGIKDFLYLPEVKVLAISISDLNVASRIDAYITNMYAHFYLLIHLQEAALGKEE